MSILPVGFGTSGYSITNSLRLRSSASAYLSRTFGAPTDNKKYTLSWWGKLGDIGASGCGLLSNGTTASNVFYFHTDNTIRMHSAGSAYVTSTQVFRDPTAHGHWVIQYDSANASAASRVLIYHNNSLVAGLACTLPQNTTGWHANGSTARIGNINGWFANSHDYYDGLFSDFYLVDGQLVAPSSFGETNSDGVWVPKAYAGTYGNNGFHLKFTDASGAQTLGTDSSGNGNNWTCNNISITAGVTYDQFVDTPTNNYATLNAVSQAAGNFAFGLQNGNLEYKSLTGVSFPRAYGTIPLGESGSYCEFVVLAGDTAGPYIGISDSNIYQSPAGGGLGFGPAEYGWQSTNGVFRNNNSTLATYSTFTTNDVIQLAYQSGKLWIGKNNVWQNSGNPAAGTGAVVTGLSSAVSWLPAVATNNSGTFVAAFNAGQRPFTYTPPSGFKALCTANLSAVAITKPANAVAATTATEDNIYTNVAAARSGWTDYVDILKNRSASESWAWQFSHDSTNEYAVQAGSLVRQAKRAMSGSNNWVGYSLRIGASYGTAAGSVSHTNGAATTVTHGVGVSARQLILLFNRAGGSAVPVYHPDLASGELLDLCANSADAASTSITSVTSTSFQIGSGVATGTYDYLVCSELSGLFKLGVYTATGSGTDQPFSYAGNSPQIAMFKVRTAADDYILIDSAREPNNMAQARLSFNLAAAESTTASGGLDRTAGGIKVRTQADGMGSAQTIVFASWAKHPFGGQNCSPAPAR